VDSAKAMGEALLVLGMGGTIDKDYPRMTMGYAFEIDEPAATRVLQGLPFLAVPFTVQSICKKDSTEIDVADRDRLVAAVRATSCTRIVVTHGTDTMIETAQMLLASGASSGKAVAFTGAMKPERFKDSDGEFNLGGAVSATSFLPPGSVVVCMGGNVIPATQCVRDTSTGIFNRVPP
jgi:L-asparaginase